MASKNKLRKLYGNVVELDGETTTIREFARGQVWSRGESAVYWNENLISDDVEALTNDEYDAVFQAIKEGIDITHKALKKL